MHCPDDSVGSCWVSAAPSLTQPTTSTVTANSAAGGIASPSVTELVHYQGPNPYTASPMFDVAYDSALWHYVENDGSGRQSQLLHRSLPGCVLWLRAGPVGAPVVADVTLAGVKWAIGQVQPAILLYTTSYETIGFTFGVLLPEAHSPDTKSSCEQAVERVIDTFKVVP